MPALAPVIPTINRFNIKFSSEKIRSISNLCALVRYTNYIYSSEKFKDKLLVFEGFISVSWFPELISDHLITELPYADHWRFQKIDNLTEKRGAGKLGTEICLL